MKVHIMPATARARSLDRVETALRQFAPYWVEFTDDLKSAELVVLHVIGRWERISRDIRRIRRRGQRYAMIQYCLRGTQRPDVRDWFLNWKHAELIWSYLPLNRWIRHDTWHKKLPNLYHRPLGVDSSVFYPRDVAKRYACLVSGNLWTTHSVREAGHAARRAGKLIANLGPEMNKKNVHCFQDISDDELARLYSACEYVTALRRTEGFEMTAAEGLLCGARLIAFDQMHYRDWFDGYAEFIEERDRQDVIADLEALFRVGSREVTDAERENAAERFDWANLVGGFWRGCLH